MCKISFCIPYAKRAMWVKSDFSPVLLKDGSTDQRNYLIKKQPTVPSYQETPKKNHQRKPPRKSANKNGQKKGPHQKTANKNGQEKKAHKKFI